MDRLQKFLLNKATVRGAWLELPGVWPAILARKSLPPAVQQLLGDMLAGLALLLSTTRFEGTMVLQVHGDGPVHLLVAECDSQFHMRATAQWREGFSENSLGLTELINAHGRGKCAVTLDPAHKKPGQRAHQSMVALEGETMAAVLENYMRQSEQIDTRLWLASDATVARGLLLQRLPAHADTQACADYWQHITTLLATVTRKELLSTDILTLARRLFWGENIEMLAVEQPQFLCGCTGEKVESMLRLLGKAEVETALATSFNACLTIDCEFCTKTYHFDQKRCQDLFL